MEPELREAPPAAAFEEISIDLFGPLPASQEGHTMILAVKCLHSRYVEAFPLLPSQVDSAGIAAVLVDQYFTRHGVPHTILSDKGSQFTSALAQELFAAMNIRKLSSSAYHPQTNGSVERFMRTLAEMLAMLVNTHHTDWHLWVSHVVFAHNTAINNSTGVEPYLLAYGRMPRLAMHQILGQLDQTLRGAQGNRAVKQVVSDLLERQKRAQEMARCRGEAHRASIVMKNTKLAEAFGLKDGLRSGGLVWLYRTPRTIKGVELTPSGQEARGRLAAKFLDPWSGPFQIVQVGPSSKNGVHVGDNVVLVRMHNGREERYNRQWLKPCHHPEDTPPTSLPDGFARYLLRRHSAEVPAPRGLDDNEATWASDRHGVTAIHNHRLVTQGRGKPTQLEYLVQWDGKDLTPSWEPEANVDACVTALQEYWRTLARSTTPIDGHRTTIIRRQIRRAGGQVTAKGVGWQEATVGARYELPKGCAALSGCPTSALATGGLIGAWIYFAFDVKSAQPEWSPGIVKGYHGKGAAKGRFSGQYGIQFMFESGQRGVQLSPTQYNCKQSAAAGDWFVWGTESALAKLQH
jgi:transposase InsO family protein